MNAPKRNARRIVRDIAHARAGDKGNTSNVNVWAYDPADFALLKRTLTVERIKQEFPALLRGEIRRYVIEHLQGLNFVMQDALEGGVNSSLNLDSHGKSWSYLILGLALDEGVDTANHGDSPLPPARRPRA
jgi:hypothetical protein